jgi:hypothetical protein
MQQACAGRVRQERRKLDSTGARWDVPVFEEKILRETAQDEPGTALMYEGMLRQMASGIELLLPTLCRVDSNSTGLRHCFLWILPADFQNVLGLGCRSISACHLSSAIAIGPGAPGRLHAEQPGAKARQPRQTAARVRPLSWPPRPARAGQVSSAYCWGET